jgi:hypothetical protein
VVFDREGKQKPDIAVRRAESTGFVPATVGWPGSAELDLTVLEADTDDAAPSHPLALLSARDVYANESWEAEGYVAMRLGSAPRTSGSPAASSGSWLALPACWKSGHGSSSR